MSTNPLIGLYEQRVELLEIQGSNASLDDALLLLESWMDKTETIHKNVAKSQ